MNLLREVNHGPIRLAQGAGAFRLLPRRRKNLKRAKLLGQVVPFLAIKAWRKNFVFDGIGDIKRALPKALEKRKPPDLAEENQDGSVGDDPPAHCFARVLRSLSNSRASKFKSTWCFSKSPIISH